MILLSEEQREQIRRLTGLDVERLQISLLAAPEPVLLGWGRPVVRDAGTAAPVDPEGTPPTGPEPAA